jgi:hypothetical protein
MTYGSNYQGVYMDWVRGFRSSAGTEEMIEISAYVSSLQ